MSRASAIFRLCSTVLLLATFACASRPPQTRVQYPPRLDLAEWRTIGIVTFEGGSDPRLASQATRHFIEMLQYAQPGARIVELGDASVVLAEIGRPALDFEAALGMRDRYGVDAVFIGNLALGEAKPHLRFGEAVGGLRARVEVTGELAAKLMETSSGALVWSRSSASRASLANLGMSDGRPVLGARDPEEVEQGLVEYLVSELRHDFHPTVR